MTPSISNKLSGNLGERHRCLNNLVHDALIKNAPIHSFQEGSAIDRLFKIDLASKQKNVEIIMNTLKDEDMLCVSRALKSFWLLEPEHSNIINPSFLEEELYTQMTLQAVNKMKHWIQKNLRDPQRCEEFYRFYKDRDFETAAKFLWHCSEEFIQSEVIDVLEKITPKHLKLLSEKVPRVTKIYYDSLKQNQTLLEYYLENDLKFFMNVKYLLKSDANIFFYVLENFFVNNKFPSLNSAATKYIMRHHKSRFMGKPELYTAWFLNVEALAKCLSSQEIKDLVLKLATADYLQSWFSYKTIEPLIKQLSVEERTAFKKLIFVDKAFGPTVKEWPYPLPAPPVLIIPPTSLFEDTSIDNYSFHPPDVRRSNLADCCAYSMDFKFSLKKRKCAKWCPVETKTLLDQLFDQYRFSNYKQTLLDLQKRLRAESSPKNRQYMLLVLVSKTGGRTEDLTSLLDLLSHYKNEPVQIRAAIFRSLVKRGFAWRLPPEHWAKLLKWGHGLGLDGSPPEAACREGLHAVVLRDLLADVTPSDAIWKAFLGDFSTLAEYSLTADERGCVCSRLPALLLATAQSDPTKALERLHLLLDTLTAYSIRFDDFPGTIEAIAAAAKIDFESAKGLLTRVYKAGVARKFLMRENFDLLQTDASYANALRHDISVLEQTIRFEELICKKDLKHEKFLRKLGLYFTEKSGLAERYYAVLERSAAAPDPDKSLARPLALLAGPNFTSLLKVFDAAPPKTPQRQLAAALRSNAHLVRPFELESFGWRAAGAKAVANRVATCRQRDAERYLLESLSWRRTLRLAVVLAKRTNREHETFEVFAAKRPGAALSTAMRYLEREGDNSDPRIWEMVRSHISKKGHRQLRSLATRNIESLPLVIRAEYCVLVYKACKMNLPEMERSFFSRMITILPDLDDQFIYVAVEDFLRDYFKDSAKLKRKHYVDLSYIGTYASIIARFLVLSTSEEMLEERFRRVGIPFLNRIERMWKQVCEDEWSIEMILDSFLLHLRYNKVYFDVKYVPCLAVFEKVTEWMQSFLPIHKWFGKYVAVHLSMIYFKTVRYCVEQDPKLFSDEEKKLKSGPDMLGTIFAKFLTNELEDLIRRYFTSITELYGAEIVNYFTVNFFNYRRDDSVNKFTRAVLNGLLTEKSVPSCVLAKHIFTAFRYFLEHEKDMDVIVKLFKESEVEELRLALDDIM